MKNNTIVFSCEHNHESIDIQLEPEAFVLRVEPGKSLKFIAICDVEFEWVLNVYPGGIQLIPNSHGVPKLQVYENDDLLIDWF